LFGKPLLAEEDAYRLESIKQNRQVVDSTRNGDVAEQFLATAEASITLEFDPPTTDRRVVELVNKTNQFNLNGIRYTEAEWRQSLQNPGSFVAVVSYRDKFGPLGKIAVLRGERRADRIELATWVMSCRAFSRRIEYQCLFQLFQRFKTQEIIFNFISTPKNGPMRDFLSGLAGEPGAALTREAFTAKCPKLYQEVTGIVDTIEQVR
jgi:FkbH-like protein